MPQIRSVDAYFQGGCFVLPIKSTLVVCLPISVFVKVVILRVMFYAALSYSEFCCTNTFSFATYVYYKSYCLSIIMMFFEDFVKTLYALGCLWNNDGS